MKRITSFSLCLTLLALPLSGFAEWTGTGTVTYVNNWPDGFNFIVDGQGHGCGGNNQQFHVPWSASNADSLYSLVLMAMASGKQLRANFGCQGDGTARTLNIDLR